MKITCFVNVKYLFDFSKRNVFTRDMRDFSVADQGKMDQTKCRKCPNSEWSFEFWVFKKVIPNERPQPIWSLVNWNFDFHTGRFWGGSLGWGDPFAKPRVRPPWSGDPRPRIWTFFLARSLCKYLTKQLTWILWTGMVLGLGKRSPGSGEYSRSNIYPNIQDQNRKKSSVEDSQTGNL